MCMGDLIYFVLIGLIVVKSGFLSRADISAARQANFGQMAFVIESTVELFPSAFTHKFLPTGITIWIKRRREHEQ